MCAGSGATAAGPRGTTTFRGGPPCVRLSVSTGGVLGPGVVERGGSGTHTPDGPSPRTVVRNAIGA